MLKIRRPLGRLIFNMGIAIPGKTVFLIETAPCSPVPSQCQAMVGNANTVKTYKTHLSRRLNCWSLRCNWSIACRCCFNYIFILGLTPGFDILRKGNCKPTRETFKFWDSVLLILETWQYIYLYVFVSSNNLACQVWCSSLLLEREQDNMSM